MGTLATSEDQDEMQHFVRVFTVLLSLNQTVRDVRNTP